MEKKYTLIDLDSTKTVCTIDDEEIKYLEFDRLFNRSVISRLAAIPDQETARARCEIVRTMISDKASYDLVTELKSALSDFSRSCTILDDSQSDFERVFAYVENVKRFYKVIETINGLFDVRMTIVLKEKVKDFSSRSKTIFGLLQKIKETLDKLDSVTLLNSKAVCSDPAGDLCSIIDNACSNLGYDVSLKKTKTVRVTDELSNVVAKSFPECFIEAQDFQNKTIDAVDRNILDLRGDLDFYLAVADVFISARNKAMPVCFPKESSAPMYRVESIIDPCLIGRVGSIVPNDAAFDVGSSIAYIMGANGGGKTSYLRALASNLILFLGGCPVFAKKANIYPFRSVRLFYPREEHSFDHGRFDEEKMRLDRFIEGADGQTFAFFNEVFSGTTESRAESELYELTHRLKNKGVFALFVTHFLNAEVGYVTKLAVTVSVDGERLFKVVPAGKAISSYANDVLKKYGLNPESLGKGEADVD